MICEKDERTVFQIRPEMENGRIGSLKLTVKSGIPLLSRGWFGGKEGKGLPVVGNVLLENAADVGVGIISSQGQWSSRMRMSQESGMRESYFCLVKGI